MKRYKLKKWVKVVLLLGVVAILLFWNYKATSAAIQECTNNGNSQTFCTYQLGR